MSARIVAEAPALVGSGPLVQLAALLCGAPLAVLHVDGEVVTRAGREDPTFRLCGSAPLPGGALSVFDAENRKLTTFQASALGALAREIGERMELERAEMRSRALTARLVHDLQNPLASLVPNVGFIVDERELSADGRVAANDLVQVSEGLRRLVLDLQDLASNRFRPKITDIDLLPMLRASRDAMRGRADEAEIVVLLPEVSARVLADPHLLRRVFDNLLDNALRYAPPVSTVEVRMVPKNGKVELRFLDGGGSVPREHREALFDVYGASSPGAPRNVRWGRVLALPFCKAALAAVGGVLRVSGNGEVCSFVLTLPEPA